MKWPWRCHVLEVSGVSVDQAPMDLTSVTSLHMLGRVLLHGWPKIPEVKQLLEKSLLALMIPTFTRMNFLHDGLCFGGPQAF